MIRGIFLTFILTIVGMASLIIILPWLWGWIVFIWSSPLPAGEATRIYLWESILECIPFVGSGVISLFLLNLLINGDKYSSNEISVFENSSPTPSRDVQNSSPVAPLETKQAEVISESRGFDFSKFTPGSPEAAKAYKQSDEAKENAEKLRTLDELIRAAKKEIA